MNRPMRKDYTVESLYELFDCDAYYEDLEEYCTEVDSKLEMATGIIDMLNEKLSYLEKAFDKACEQLELMSEAHYISREEWKEWLMKDE